ncbi:MAG: MBL fold metallo-hydrolase [Veillonella sp.]|uniref:ComEC/Rec2 family competence protein n=1 Tax=Veillonella sp. TaxID=1926307 RepID=UPI0025CC7EE8|nr:ComEC/Rec2 family competence protein [Veillonella sp.]MBE6079641.1 MBL fold metallo-hydrolase [Veillonella sp.]
MQLNNKFWAKYLAIVFAFLVSFFALTGCSEVSGSTIGDNFNKIYQAILDIGGNGTNDSETLDVYTLDIGQGDAHLIRVGNEFSLIDTGDVDHRDNLVAQLKKYNVKSLKNVIITHPHSDHLGGFHALIDAGIPIEHVYDNGMKYKTSVYNTYVKDTDKKNLKRIGLYKGMTVDLGKDAQFVVYAPEEGQYIMDKKGQPDPNDNSIVGKLVFGKFSMLFTGDASRAEENKLIKEENTKLSSRILKVGHHGSASSSQKDFIRSVRPEKAVISVGLHNDYGHPTREALNRLAAENVMVYTTAQQGTIRIHTDGSTWQVTAER